MSAHELMVVLEDMQSQFRVFGEGQAALGRRLTEVDIRLTAEIRETREVLGAAIRENTARIGDLERQSAVTERRLTGVEDRLTGVEGRLTGVEDRLTGVESELARVQNRLDGVDARLDRKDETVH